MVDKKDKVKYLDPDWEKTTTELVHEMSEQYRIKEITSQKHFGQVIIISDVTWYTFPPKLCHDR